jgi:hypothetical protein
LNASSISFSPIDNDTMLAKEKNLLPPDSGGGRF